MSTRRRFPSEVIDRMEGDASASGSDLDGLSRAQLNARRVGSHRLVADLASDATTATTDDDTDANTNGHATRITWSDDDDPSSEYQRYRNSLKRKREPTHRKPTATAKKAPTSISSKKTTTGVGKVVQRNPAAKPRERRAGAAAQAYGDESSDDEGTIEAALPDYLKQRRQQVEVEKAIPGPAAGLRVPPSYDDIEFSDDERLEALSERPDFPHANAAAPYKDRELRYSMGVVPAPIAQWLREYQVQGAEFLHELFVYQKGGILGDDMGLGKTIQVIAFLAAAFGKTGDERDGKRMRKMRRHPSRQWYPKVLLVVPGGLMENWQSELRKWGWWNVDLCHGAKKETALQAARAGRLEIMITAYDTYRLNKSAINMIEWDCVIADECHKIKERKSEITKAMNEVNALCRIGLTGTAIQNKYEELWTLLNWTNPGRFGPLSTWKSAISDPLRLGQSHDATVPQLAKARKTAKKLVENLLPAFFLRRMKNLIADQLPKKTDRVVFCPLTPTQAEAYENYVDSDKVQCISQATELCECNSGKKRGWCCHKFLPQTTIPWQNSVFPCIATLQKLSNHLALLIPSGSDLADKQSKDLDNLQMAEPDRWREFYSQRDNIRNFANPEFCGKWKVLKKLLKFWYDNGDKVLIFSHSVRLLKMLQLLFQTTTSYNVSYLDGGMSYEERAKVVEDFNADSAQFVFLISTKAGGVGLNIVSANKVVVVDPNWNPAWDLQAQDRAYRIGQLRDVEVFRLVSAGTIEEIVYARQIYKQQQANIGYNASSERRYFTGVQENKEKKGEIFGLVNLFSYQGDNVVLRDIVNKTNVAESKAGVRVIGLDLNSTLDDWDDDPLKDNDDDPGGAMKQLAALVSQGDESPDAARKMRSTKSDAIHAILASAGVEYTHENSEVIGSSKIEARLSKRAQEAGNDSEMIDEYVFAKSQSQRGEDIDGLEEMQDLSDDGAAEGKSKVAYKYRPPEEVRKRQFCTMAATFGFADATELALMVESWTQAQRRAFLERFYNTGREKASKGGW